MKIRIKRYAQTVKNKVFNFIDLHPMGAFFTLLLFTLSLIIIGNIIRKPIAIVEKNGKTIPQVSVFNVGSAPKVSLQAKIEKSGVIKIISLTSGIVQQIYKSEGDHIYKGQWIVGLSSNFQGASAPSYTRQLAQTNYQFLLDNYDVQKDIINKNKDIAQKAESQSFDLRDISSKSINETKASISLNEDVVSMLDKQITYLESINVNNSSDSAILQLKSSKSSVMTGLNQAKSTLRNLEYQTNNDNDPAEITRIQKDLTLKQLDLQEKTLDLNKEISRLNVRLAEIQESLMYPSSPFNGIVERVHVKIGQAVSPGTVLASITGDINTMKAVVTVSQAIASKVSMIEPSVLHTNGTTVTLYPTYISQEPTVTGLHTIIFSIPDEYGNILKNDQIIPVEIPIGPIQTFSADPYIPIDALYQTQTESSLFIVKEENKKKIARNIQVSVGEAYGSYIEVLKGLKNEDLIILNRNIVDGDEVMIEH